MLISSHYFSTWGESQFSIPPLLISLSFEHFVGACRGSLWFVHAIDLY